MSHAKTPALKCLRASVTAPASSTTVFYVDLAQWLSATNRRLYRSGRHYQVSSVVCHDSDPAGSHIKFSVVPDTWMSRGAFRKSFAMWKKMRSQVTDYVKPGKWADFRPYLSHAHVGGTKLMPSDVAANAPSQDEWAYSLMWSPRDGGSASPDYDSFQLCYVGDDNGSLGSLVTGAMIKAYQETRSRVTGGEPDGDADLNISWMTNLFDTGDHLDDLSDWVDTVNDNSPYNSDDFVGGENEMPAPVIVSEADCNLSNPVSRAGSFGALGGLVRIDVTNRAGSNNVVSFCFNLKPGSYKGVDSHAI